MACGQCAGSTPRGRFLCDTGAVDGDGKKALQISVLGILVPAVISIVVWLWPNPLQSGAGAQASSPPDGSPTAATPSMTSSADPAPTQGAYSVPSYSSSPSSTPGGLLPLSEAYGGECFNYLPMIKPGKNSIDPLPSAGDVEWVGCFQPHDAEVISRTVGDDSSAAFSACEAQYGVYTPKPGSRDYVQMISYQGEIGAVCVVTFDTPTTGLL